MKGEVMRSAGGGFALYLTPESEVEAVALAAWGAQAVTLANFAGQTMPMRHVQIKPPSPLTEQKP